MTNAGLLQRSLKHYWRTNLAVIAGAAVAVAVLAGSFVVGQSVKGSLRALALERTGKTHAVLAGDPRCQAPSLHFLRLPFHLSLFPPG
ncbi:MAG: hypothetical protein ACKV22_12195 [Bryobacteraceae bacterium]